MSIFSSIKRAVFGDDDEPNADAANQTGSATISKADVAARIGRRAR